MVIRGKLDLHRARATLAVPTMNGEKATFQFVCPASVSSVASVVIDIGVSNDGVNPRPVPAGAVQVVAADFGAVDGGKRFAAVSDIVDIYGFRFVHATVTTVASATIEAEAYVNIVGSAMTVGSGVGGGSGSGGGGQVGQ